MRINEYAYLLDDVQKWLFVSFAFFLPVSQKISTLNIVFLVIVSLLNARKENIDFKKEFIAPIGLYIIYCLSILYSSELQLGIIEQKASLLFFPIIFIFNKNAIKYHELILKYFVLGCLVALTLCEFNAFYNSFDFTNLIFDSRTDKSIIFYNSILKEENFFFSYCFSFIHQTVYFSMYLLFAIAIIFYKNLFKNKLLGYGFVLFFLIGIFQILNKASLIVLFVILILKAYLSIKSKRTATISTVLLIITAVSIFMLNPRFKNFYKNNFVINNSELKVKDYKKINNTNPNSNTNFRVMLWVSAIELIKENPLFGIGAGGSHDRLYEVFAVKRQWYDKNEKYHAHNQYLQILLDIGVVGFIPFVLLFVFLIKIYFSLKEVRMKYLTISFILIIGINFLFESMFERYSGISFFCFFYCLFISNFSIEDRRKAPMELT